MTMKGFLSDDYMPLRELLRTFTYRPDWSFSLEELGPGPVLVVRAMVINTDNHREIIPLQFGIGLPSMVRPEFNWTQWLFAQIMTIEDHEAREFFQVNGVKVFDPHG